MRGSNRGRKIRRSTAIFPDGVPPKESVIRELSRWWATQNVSPGCASRHMRTVGAVGGAAAAMRTLIAVVVNFRANR
jgi:hypothetical protein